jgi:hypothetical protein
MDEAAVVAVLPQELNGNKEDISLPRRHQPIHTIRRRKKKKKKKDGLELVGAHGGGDEGVPGSDVLAGGKLLVTRLAAGAGVDGEGRAGD